MTALENGRHLPVAVIGAGQAGLSISRLLTDQGVEHLVIERDSIAHDWIDRRWDNFTLVTPNWQCRLPGYPYDGDDPDGFMTRAEVHAWVRRYAESFGAPVAEDTEVLRLRESADGAFEIVTSRGTITADQVVVATGGYHRPVLPAVAHRIPDSIVQLHSADYRSAAALPEGGVLVVGSGQSGAQIAEDLFLEGRDVHLALGTAPRVARFYRGRDCVAWLADMGVYDVPVHAQVGGLSKRESTNHYVTGRGGGRDIDLRAFARDGMTLYGRLQQVDGGSLRFAPTAEASLDYADSVAESIKNDIDAYIERSGVSAPTEARYAPVWRPEHEIEELDLAAAGITSIVWAVGFRSDYSWMQIGVFDGAGHPTHRRGATAVPGLHFLGLPWLNTWGSGRFEAIARDAEHVAEQLLGGARMDRLEGAAVR
ncbi:MULTISPECIES: MSMEG_0569 family flavin-dependent oxidoreductase [unclassified Rathayibacter]|uniref:MSMEG_0569 family flavin-dependent oxidoreductase n=1 Tax=unclassified Rathayibacter TaxID=2609250 RepID=UPI0010529758|nr:MULTISPECIES: MSMEG_0569 family flavin-dependent oxidoreductase [unclassified Rathayibacter]MCJ1704627.1 MSMEG_0569 family flavin-dependent oxidoreductase [Rathayibacter sp. VKM Ac-2926]TCL78878.1 putative flavoprotein involved in K+ transport [Rathayibacter sp. PhB192]TCM24956.1 putative flavoprotein involved in K+ transport [Rathayibacter sp. PhB179]